MKTTGRCPKCGSADLLAVEPGLYNSFPIGFLKMQKFRGMSAAAAAIQKSGLPRSLWRSCGSLLGMTKNKKDRGHFPE